MLCASPCHLRRQAHFCPGSRPRTRCTGSKEDLRCRKSSGLPPGCWARPLAAGNLAAGAHEMTWTGTDPQDRPVARGLYFAVLEFGGERRVRKVTPVR